MQLVMQSQEAAWPVRRAHERRGFESLPSAANAQAHGARLARVRPAVLSQFSRHAFHKVGIRDVAREAGCGIAVLYKIADTKDQLLSLCLAPDFQARASRLKAASRREVGTRARLRACITELVKFDLDRPDFAQIVRVNTPACLVRDAGEGSGTEGVIEEILTRGTHDGSVRTDLSPQAITDLVCALTDGALGRWAQAGCASASGSRERLAAERADLVWAVIWPAVSSA